MWQLLQGTLTRYSYKDVTTLQVHWNIDIHSSYTGWPLKDWSLNNWSYNLQKKKIKKIENETSFLSVFQWPPCIKERLNFTHCTY